MATSQSPFADQDFVDLGLPIRTDRLVLRHGGPDDVDTLHARRNQPAVQEFQSWTFPYARKDAAELLTELAKMSGPTLGEWWMLMVDLADNEGQAVGDVAIHLDESGNIVEIGYNLTPDHWGNGYATEAVAAVIDSLYRTHPGLIRLQAQVHPDNLASAGVVERCGLRYEGQTRLSFVPRDANQEPSDDRMYSLLRQDWLDWADRPTGQPELVRFVDITADNLDEVCDLAVHKSQDQMVAPVEFSLAQALVPPVRNGRPLKPWYRAVEADGDLVGFVMMIEPDEGRPDPYLMRLLVDRCHQRRGIGRAVLDLVVDQSRSWGGTQLTVSWTSGPGSPERFYEQYGFVPTGLASESGEIPGSLAL